MRANKLWRGPQLRSGNRERFKIVPFQNPGGTVSWRVTGCRRDGKQVRENFSDPQAARCRQLELETEFLRERSEAAEVPETIVRATKLSENQLRLCEVVVASMGEHWPDLVRASEAWLRHGKAQHVAESPRIDNAVEDFKKWLDGQPPFDEKERCTLRPHSRTGLRVAANMFANSIQNLRVSEITPEIVETFLDGLKNVTATTRDNRRRGLSRFFAWCISRPRRWAVSNPCKEVRIEKEEKGAPTILSIEECERLLRAAEQRRLGAYTALCLFGGLRPFEASRLSWEQVNLTDREIRLEGTQTKTGRSRVVAVCDTLLLWLKTHENEPFFPPNWRRTFDAVKEAAGFGSGETAEGVKLKPWIADVMRHTAISHYFRKTGSYGQTAEMFGNSESIIKAHYQGRVSSEDMTKFYSLRPTKKKGAK